jgi:hypothetical protein
MATIQDKMGHLDRHEKPLNVLLISWHILVEIIWHTRSFLAVPADPGKRLKLHMPSEYAFPKSFHTDSQLVRQIISSEVCQIMREVTPGWAQAAHDDG